jgi:hypothetical protein
LKEAEAEKAEKRLKSRIEQRNQRIEQKRIKEANEKLAQAQQNQGNASLSIKSIQTQHDGYTLTTLEPVLDITTRVQEYVEQIYQARKYYHENKQALPVYITDNLLALAKNDHFIELLQSYKDHSVLTFNTQHEVKTQLATAINSIKRSCHHILKKSSLCSTWVAGKAPVPWLTNDFVLFIPSQRCRLLPSFTTSKHTFQVTWQRFIPTWTITLV